MRMWKEEDRKRKEGEEMSTDLDSTILKIQKIFQLDDEKIAALEITIKALVQERDELRKKLESQYETPTKGIAGEEAPPVASPAYLVLARQSLRRERDRLQGNHHDDICIAVEGILNFLEKK